MTGWKPTQLRDFPQFYSILTELSLAKQNGHSGHHGVVAHNDTLRRHVCFGRTYRVFSKMEDAGGQHSVSATLENTIRQVLQIANATGGDDRNFYGIRDSAGDPQVKAIARTVPVHARQQNLARAQRGHSLCPSDRIDAGRFASAVCEHLPPAVTD